MELSQRFPYPTMPRFFNLLEAEGLLPEVEGLLKGLLQLKQDYERTESQLTRMLHRIALSGGMIPPRQEIGQLRQRKDATARGLESSLEKLQETGCLLKDVDTGLVDFPTLYRGKEVYLCWRLGESGITHWHHVEDGFRGRKPIDGDFLANHRGE
jgi:hypothetical protein